MPTLRMMYLCSRIAVFCTLLDMKHSFQVPFCWKKSLVLVVHREFMLSLTQRRRDLVSLSKKKHLVLRAGGK